MTKLSAEAGPAGAAGGKGWSLQFGQSPVEFLESPGEPGRVGAVRVELNRLEGDSVGARRAVGTGQYREIECGLVLKSIGYKGLPLSGGCPFDERWGVVPNEHGRVAGTPGLYASGWIKTGPTGVIATTMNHAFDTASSILADIKAGALPGRADGAGPAAVDSLLRDRGVEVVPLSGWDAIDRFELAEGAAAGKVREKVVSLDAMMRLADGLDGA